jgi:hypothetical protein
VQHCFFCTSVYNQHESLPSNLLIWSPP